MGSATYQKVSKTNIAKHGYLCRGAGEKEEKKKQKEKNFYIVIFKAVSLPKNVAGNLRLGVKICV